MFSFSFSTSLEFFISFYINTLRLLLLFPSAHVCSFGIVLCLIALLLRVFDMFICSEVSRRGPEIKMKTKKNTNGQRKTLSVSQLLNS